MTRATPAEQRLFDWLGSSLKSRRVRILPPQPVANAVVELNEFNDPRGVVTTHGFGASLAEAVADAFARMDELS